MPHIAPKATAAKSPFDINQLLRLIRDETPPQGQLPIRLLGMGGSNLEFHGLFSVMVEDEFVDRVVDLWLNAGFKDAKAYGEPDGVHLDYAIPGQDGSFGPDDLLAAVNRARRHHPGGVVSDITIGIKTMTFWLDGTEVVRDDNDEYPMEDDSKGGDPKEAFPIQIYLLVPPARGQDGNVV